jgi:hypothetical protein
MDDIASAERNYNLHYVDYCQVEVDITTDAAQH